MTVAQFQKIHEINNTTPDTVERLGWIICALYNKTEEEVNDWNPKKFFKYVARIEKQINGKPSKLLQTKLQSDASNITLGQFIECQHWLKNDVIQSLDLVAASLLFKRKDHAADAERVRNKPFAFIYLQVQQFIESMNKLIQSYAGLFEQEETEDDEPKEKAHPFIERYGWIFSAKELATYEGITLEQVYDIPIIQAFNGLSYLKAKASYEKMKSKI